jgi:hypothetical protein
LIRIEDTIIAAAVDRADPQTDVGAILEHTA